MLTVSFLPDSHEGKCKSFVDENMSLLAQLYPGKWVVVRDCKVFFVAESSAEMFDKACALGMERGTYYYRHIPEPLDVIHVENWLGL